ncbi:uncharacterized protein LOC136087078 [Hydra vulgaris]|uniref:Uncharacterized protein LOC136087078 n=1 Tax=Hydra vulgaris TaxID=6087 RepID=A0ABM4CUN1_HYDVU
MKFKDLQKFVLSKYQNGDGPSKIFADNKGVIGFRTINRWCQMIREEGSIEMKCLSGGPRSVRTNANIQKIRSRLKRKKRISTRKLANKLNISRTSVQRMLQKGLNLQAYKHRVEPLLTNGQKVKRIKFANWIKNHFRKEQTLKILFSDENFFDLNGRYNAQNDRIWSTNRNEADKDGGIKQKQKFTQKVMVWLGACSKGVSPLVILAKDAVNHDWYIKKLLPVALKYGNEMFCDDCTFQQDGLTSHTHHLTQQWCHDNFPAFIDKNRWSPNSPDLNPLDYSIWD